MNGQITSGKVYNNIDWITSLCDKYYSTVIQKLVICAKVKNKTTMSEDFKTPIDKSYKESKWIFIAHKYMIIL